MIGDTGSVGQPGSSGSGSSSRPEPSPATDARITQLDSEIVQMRNIVRDLSEIIRAAGIGNQIGGGGHNGGDSGAP